MSVLEPQSAARAILDIKSANLMIRRAIVEAGEHGSSAGRSYGVERRWRLWLAKQERES